MNNVGEMQDRKEKPAYVRFERRGIEDRAASEREGRYVERDMDFALVTAPYSRDVFEQIASDWLAQYRKDAENGRVPMEWYERYSEQYKRWLKGEEMPLDGIAIKGWAVISPAQQKNLIAINVLTVEDLAGINDEGMRRIGMGAGELRDKARAWLSQTKDKGPLTMENATLRSENLALKARTEQLEARNKELAERLEILQRGGLERGTHFERPAEIAASDILPEDTHPQAAEQALKRQLHARKAG